MTTLGAFHPPTQSTPPMPRPIPPLRSAAWFGTEDRNGFMSAAIPAVDARRYMLAHLSGMRIVEMLRPRRLPRRRRAEPLAPTTMTTPGPLHASSCAQARRFLGRQAAART